jgi:hypothetical protein
MFEEMENITQDANKESIYFAINFKDQSCKTSSGAYISSITDSQVNHE